ncbi:hypothetical protein HPP92_009026 [Vanilla planifolia]|uniref:U-box domain-containing protein n=1 Tax=Vanilla planifolia TaxID=51239 RepID=A0A835RD21_VANPL|nr:hypothetical protein HPP92_009026 [Vanilla planifolia]
MAEGADQVQAPPYFLCPISLQIMRDPVTLPTGITFERECIEQWLFSTSKFSSSAAPAATCPVTNQSILRTDLTITPNHTLRRLIQSWCASRGVERFPTPRAPLDDAQLSSILRQARLPNSQLSALKMLRSIVSDSDRNKLLVESFPAAIDLLLSAFVSSPPQEEGCDHEAMAILCMLKIPDRTVLESFSDILDSLTSVLRRSRPESPQPRAHAVLLMKSLLRERDIPATKLMSLKQGMFDVVVGVLKDRVSYTATKAALQVIHGACPWGRNAAKAVRAGAVAVLVEALLDEPERKACEMMMVVLEELCSGCEKGLEELIGHAAGIAVVGQRMLRVSPLATESAVRLFRSITSTRQGKAEVVEEMMQFGVVSKLIKLLLHDGEVVIRESAKEMAREMLRKHARVWRSSPCITPQLRALYPPSA